LLFEFTTLLYKTTNMTELQDIARVHSRRDTFANARLDGLQATGNRIAILPLDDQLVLRGI